MEMRCKYEEKFVTNHWSPLRPDHRPFRRTEKRYGDYIDFMYLCFSLNAEEEAPNPAST